LPVDWSGELIPVLVDYHGGSFIMGSCLEQAPFCAMVARETKRVVISVDYSLGPLDQFPKAIEDAEDVLNAVLNVGKAGRALRDGIMRYLGKHGRIDVGQEVLLDTKRIAISGFSSGGNLALNLALNVPELNWPSLLSNQPSSEPLPLLLFYPSFDSRLMEYERPLLGKPQEPSAAYSIDAILSPTYLPKDKRSHLRASPGLVHTKNIVPNAKILLILPEIDTLAQQSEVWVRKMEEEGNDKNLTVERIKGIYHGWTQFPDFFLDSNARAQKVVIMRKTMEFLRKNTTA